MGLLKEATNEQAFAKIGIFGEAGSGKTTTASFIAMGISRKFGKDKPVAFFETEHGSDFLVDRFKEEGLKLLRVRSHSLSDLIEFMKEAEETCSVALVDSITHVWDNLLESKLQAVNKAREKKRLWKLDKLEFQHFNDIKREWGRWTTAYLNSNIHSIVCGRAGDIYDFVENEETQKKELQKGGTRMKAEKTFGYEPFLLIEMERLTRGNKAGSGYLHRAHILKDKSDIINGEIFDFEKPKKGYVYKAGDFSRTFTKFLPALASLNLGGVHHTIDVTRNSEGLFPGQDGESTFAVRAKKVTIALEEIQGTLVALYPGQDANSKAAKQAIIETLFSTRSWTAVESKKLEDLEKGLNTLRSFESEIKSGTTFDSIEELKNLLTKLSSDFIDTTNNDTESQKLSGIIEDSINV